MSLSATAATCAVATILYQRKTIIDKDKELDSLRAQVDRQNMKLVNWEQLVLDRELELANCRQLLVAMNAELVNCKQLLATRDAELVVTRDELANYRQPPVAEDAAEMVRVDTFFKSREAVANASTSTPTPTATVGILGASFVMNADGMFLSFKKAISYNMCSEKAGYIEFMSRNRGRIIGPSETLSCIMTVAIKSIRRNPDLFDIVGDNPRLTDRIWVQLGFDNYKNPNDYVKSQDIIDYLNNISTEASAKLHQDGMCTAVPITIFYRFPNGIIFKSDIRSHLISDDRR